MEGFYRVISRHSVKFQAVGFVKLTRLNCYDLTHFPGNTADLTFHLFRNYKNRALSNHFQDIIRRIMVIV